MNPNFDAIGKAFVEQYYKVFDADRTQLRPLYRADSMLTFEGTQVQGTDAIIQKLQNTNYNTKKIIEMLKSLPFQTVQHVVTTVDCQPATEFGVIIHVVGQLKADNDPPHSFSQTFCLRKDPSSNSNFYCFNDMFRLSLHHG